MADQVAVLAGGCFWCTEAVFLDVVGVKSVESGYTGGQSPIRPTSRSAAATPAMPRRSGSPSIPSRSATTICSTSSSRPTIRPSSIARAMTSARNTARRSSRSDDEQERKARAGDRARQCRSGRWHRHHDRAAWATGGRPRTITRIIGRAKASAIPIASRSSRRSSRSSARASRRGTKSAARHALKRCGRPSQAIVDRRSEAFVRGRARPRCAAWPMRRHRAAGRIAAPRPRPGRRSAEAGVADDGPEADQKFVRLGAPWPRAAAALTAHSGWRVGPALRCAVRRQAQHRLAIGAGPQQPQPAAVAATMVDFEPALGRSAVEDQRDSPAEAPQHMLGAGRADRAAGIGRRRGQRPADGAQQGLHRRMRRHTQADRSAARRSRGRQCAHLPQRNDQRQRAGPMLARPAPARFVRTRRSARPPQVGDMDDQRVEARPALGFVDARYGFRVGRVGGEPVDGLGRQPRPARRRGSAARLRRCCRR